MKDIVIRDLTLSYGEKKIIQNFSAVFRSGGITCIEGGSGSGKTTLLKAIAGLMTPESGTISGVPEKIAVVFQEDRLCESFSAVSNIRLVCGKPKEEIAAHLHELSLPAEREDPVSEYSGGMKRRVAIARAICYEADCILLDEPFGGLDAKVKKDVMDYVLRHTKGKTVICVTHDREESAYLGGDRIRIERKRPGADE